MMMLDYNTNHSPSMLGQRRKSSPECLFRFKPTPIQQSQNSLEWLKPNINRHSFIATPSDIRSISPTFYSSSSSFSSSIALPAAPVLSGSNFSSLKKRKRLSPRASLKDDFFKPPEMLSSDVRTDIELATEIGQGLLSEVRRMQTLLSERQSTLNQLTHEKQENQSRIHELVKQLRSKSESEERLKQDLWDLELAKQELNHHVRQLSAAIQKAQLEQSKREKQDSMLQTELHALKQTQEHWQDVLKKTQSDYEAKLSQLHDSLFQLSQEKEAISHQLENLKRHEEQPVEKENPKTEEELRTLQISLEKANHAVENLQLDLEKEKTKKKELDELLKESQETIESMQRSSSIPYEVPVHPLVMVPDPQLQRTLPYVMHTMMGEWMLKYTRYSSNHRRFFWLHPYTKTLYWSQQEPSHGGEYKAKSALIESFYVEEYSGHGSPVIVIKSSKRDIRIQCLAKESHETWIQSLTYLFEKENDKPSKKTKRLSLLLETHPPVPDTIKKKWRMSFTNIQEKPRQLPKRPHSMVFGPLKISSKETLCK